ncbi:MAG: asparagine synthase-related protein, partial [Acidobacteriota bacterium]
GGDNWLGVADSHAADLMRGGRVGELYRFIKSDIVTGGASVKGSLRRLLWAGGLRPHLDSWWARIAPGPKLRYHRRKWHERLPAWLCPDAGLREALIDRLLARRTPPLTAAGGAPRSYYQHSLRSLANPYMHHENETAFHIETWCRLRLLSPYHDRRLVDFFNRIPPHVLVHGDRYKGLLRPVVERHLPHLGLENQRKDYPADLQLRKLRDLRRAIANAGRAAVIRRLADLGVIQTITIGHEIACADTLSFEALARLFTILSAERWLGEHATT